MSQRSDAISCQGWQIIHERFADSGGRWYATHNGRGHPNSSPLYADTFSGIVEKIWAVDDDLAIGVRGWESDRQLPLLLRRWIKNDRRNGLRRR